MKFVWFLNWIAIIATGMWPLALVILLVVAIAKGLKPVEA